MGKNLIILGLLVLCAGLATALWWQSTVPPTPVRGAVGGGAAAAGLGRDVQVTLQESYLDRHVRAEALRSGTALVIGDIQTDLKPDKQVLLWGTTSFFGLSIPLVMDLRLSVAQGKVRGQVVGAQAGPVNLPEAVRDEAQALVDEALDQALTLEGTGLEVADLQTDENAITLYLQQGPRG